MSNLKVLYQATLTAAEAFKTAKAAYVSGDVETIRAKMAAEKAFLRADGKFQTEVEAIGIQNIPGIREMYDAIEAAI